MSNIGLIISLIVIAAGLLWLFILALRGKEVERRIVFLFIGLAVSVPLLFNITFSEKATPIVMDVFNKIENLPEGSKILLSYDYGPSMAPEVEPMSNAFLRHALAKGHKVYIMCLWATGQSLAATAIDSIVIKEFPDKIYGEDYINIGFKAGGTGVLNVIITDFRKMYLTTAGGCAAVSAPLLYPYYPKQLLGLLGGIKGAAEYESQLKKVYKRFEGSPTPGIKMMGPQTLAHLIVMAFIVIGNISYFVSRRRQK